MPFLGKVPIQKNVFKPFLLLSYVHYCVDECFFRFAKRLERDFSIPFFVQVCISGIVICGLAHEAAKVGFHVFLS